MKKILLPIVFPIASRALASEVATFARRFKSEIVLLHIVTPPGHLPGMPMHGHELTEHDRQVVAIRQAQENLDQALPELEGVTVRRLLYKGDAATEILRTAREQDADLIAMSTHSQAALYSLLLGSTAAKVLHHADCPVLTDTHGDAKAKEEFTIHRVLCAVELSPHSRNTVLRAAQLAMDFGARLTLVHVTPGAELYGPGGSYVVPEWNKTLVAYASQ